MNNKIIPDQNGVVSILDIIKKLSSKVKPEHKQLFRMAIDVCESNTSNETTKSLAVVAIRDLGYEDLAYYMALLASGLLKEKILQNYLTKLNNE